MFNKFLYKVGIFKRCPTCKGEGYVIHAHAYHSIRDERVCLTCWGKKYIKKTK